MSKSQTLKDIQIPRPDIRIIEIPIRGTAPLIVHRWSEKAKKEILAKQMKKAKVGKRPKNPEEDFQESLYRLPEDPSRYGFPSVAFKAAMVRAAKQAGIPMTDARVMLHVVGEFVEIHGEPRMREDMVRLQGGVADIRFRGEFPEWSAVVPIKYNALVISEEQIVNLLSIAGFSVGVGEWRPERNGQYGTFEVVLDA